MKYWVLKAGGRDYKMMARERDKSQRDCWKALCALFSRKRPAQPNQHGEQQGCSFDNTGP